MFIILGFYKFKNLKSLKRQKKILENLFSENDIRGTLIISKEGLNGTLSGKSKNISKISKIIKNFLRFPMIYWLLQCKFIKNIFHHLITKIT